MAMDVRKCTTVADVALQLGVRKQTVYRWIAAGQLRGFRLPGGHFRVPVEELERLRALGERNERS